MSLRTNSKFKTDNSVMNTSRQKSLFLMFKDVLSRVDAQKGKCWGKGAPSLQFVPHSSQKGCVSSAL